MSAKHSKEVTACIRSGDHLLSAFDVEGPRVAACFLDETRPHFEEGDAEPNPGGFLVAAGRKVRGSLDHLVESDFAVARAEGWESTLRKRFKEDKRELAFCIVAFRRLVMGQYVEPDLANLGLEPLNVRDGMTVVRRGELVGERFEAPNLAKMLGKSRFDKPIDLGPYVAEIRKKAAALLALSHEINEAHRASDRARIARSRAKDAYDRVYLRAARIFEDLCRFCGLDDLADRVRRREARASTSVDAATEGRATQETTEQNSMRQEEVIRVPDSRPAPESPVPSDGRSDASAPQPSSTSPAFLSRLLRPLRRQRGGVRPERAGVGDGDDRSADESRVTAHPYLELSALS